MASCTVVFYLGIKVRHEFASIYTLILYVFMLSLMYLI